jgi:alkanesulfonate monooxygenase SsuD/methylene tetrahydromethanopterin reductase-like flavin-dependent oxidoreductase (luciferase family)
MLKIGVYKNGINTSFAQMREYIMDAEAMGYDAFWTMDNNVLSDPASGEELSVFDAWTLLPALASVTSRIRMGPLVTPCRRRHPALLAKITSSFDRISNGRLDLGLGPGDHPVYFVPWGMTYPKASVRIEILREEIEVLRRMWKEDKTTYEGKYYTLRDATNHPKPIQKPHPPIWIGLVLGRKLMPKLAAEVADGINVYNASDVATKELLDAVEENCEAAGRDFAAIPKSRNVYVVFSDQRAVVPELRQVIASPEELARIRELSLDSQAEVMAKSRAQKLDYTIMTERFVIGTPQEIAEQLGRTEEMGFDQLIVAGLESASLMERFRQEVWPLL